MSDLHVVLQTGPQTLDWVIVVATVVIATMAAVSAGSAVVAAVLTRRLTQDNRALLKVGTEPEVVAYLGMERRSTYLVHLVLENVGQGPACDVEYFVDADPQDFADHGVLRVPANTQRKIASLIPQGERSQRLMGGSLELLGGGGQPALQPFRVRVSYVNLRGVRVEAKEYTLDVSELREVVEVEPSGERLANSLEKIEKHFASVRGTSDRLRVETITTAERREEREALLASQSQQAPAEDEPS